MFLACIPSFYVCSQVINFFRHGLGESEDDAILGLCWLRKDLSRFVAGSSRGRLLCCDATSDVASAVAGSPIDARQLGVEPIPGIVHIYPKFNKLTSVHIDSQDCHMLACGYSNDVRLYDLATGTVLRNFENVSSSFLLKLNNNMISPWR